MQIVGVQAELTGGFAPVAARSRERQRDDLPLGVEYRVVVIGREVRSGRALLRYVLRQVVELQTFGRTQDHRTLDSRSLGNPEQWAAEIVGVFRATVRTRPLDGIRSQDTARWPSSVARAHPTAWRRARKRR